MKRYGNLFEEIVSFANLDQAFQQASRTRRFRSDVLAFKQDLEANLFELQRELREGSYRTGAYRIFFVHEPKKREIFALPFRDRVVHHALMNVLSPILERTFIPDSYACRVGKGTHRAVERLTLFLRRAQRRWGEVYCLKADIRQFFPSVNHHVLMSLLRRKLKCRRTLMLLHEIIFSNGDQWEPESRNLPIGNLTSQWFCNYYLTMLDHFIKHELRAPYYLRYMDDFVLLAPDKPTLHAWRSRIESFLAERLKLGLNRKTCIFPARLGVEFVGYRTWSTHRLLRKASRRRMARSLRGVGKRLKEGRIDRARYEASINSWLAQLSHADGYTLGKKLFTGLVPDELIAERLADCRRR
jgi:retron-type reverse transcriptase